MPMADRSSPFCRLQCTLCESFLIPSLSRILTLDYSADYVSEQMRLETNFLHEATNAQKCADFLANTPELKDKVYVPKVYSEVASSERVMVMEYVKGCR